jgi:putative peptide zinc metalloprotease protein
METTNETRLSSIEVVQVSDNTFALECNNKLYYIGAVLFRIIQYVKAGKAFPEIQELVAAEYKLALSRQKFDEILDDTLSKIITAADSDTPTKQAYVYGQVKLISERTLEVLTRQLDFLFRKAVGLPMLILAVVVTALFLLRLDQAKLLHKTIPVNQGIAMILGGYLFFIVVGLFHELGHATAAARHNIRPKEVGFGFYLVLPVLYTDVSKIWVLTKGKRIMVNIAGIYFQLLINIALYAAYEISLLNGGAASTSSSPSF